MTASIKDIDVFTLCKESTQLQGALPLAQLTRLADELIDCTGALNYTVQAMRDADKRAYLSLNITGELPMNCQRCAEPLRHAINVDNTLELVHTEIELDDEEDEVNAILAGENPVEKIVGSAHFDLLNLLEDEVILALPIVVAHEVCEQALPVNAGEKVSPFDALRTLNALKNDKTD